MMKKLLMLLMLGMMPVMAICAAAASNGKQPLLMQGKHELYQRVLSVPGARMATEAGGQGGETVLPFTAFYVYARRTVVGTEWLQLGTNRHGNRAGWLPLASTLEWNHGLTAAFRDPAGNHRVLLFEDSESVRQLTRQQDPAAYDRLYQAAVQDKLPADSPVIAIQPPGYIDIREDFYLVPIHHHEDIYLGSEKARLLQISSVPLSSEPVADEKSVASQAYTAGLVFVVDATLSMDPYIDRTREAVKTIYNTLGDADLLGNVNFGLVAFRDNVAAAPQLDYLTRTYVTLEQDRDGKGFLSRVKSLKAASTSSRDFKEDAYAGVKQAIESMNWRGHDARYVVLITDAGAREAGDPFSSTGLGAASLKQLAIDKGVAIFVLHLLTPATMADHARDARQYQTLAD
ncbi:MAG: VWA domain-containing protein, partial [Gammaproteobacteria bacterium]|nr:VWA domain-containing protein [Gammaproteobacteria bacterium]